MARTVKTLDKLPVDIFAALKRAYLKHGYVPETGQTTIEAQPAKTLSKLVRMSDDAHDVLFRANTVFPLTLFPDTITLDREKLTIATRYFFTVAKISSAPVRDILSVEASVGPIFGSVRVSSRYFNGKSKSVNFLWRWDAIELQRLLQGYIIAHEKKMDCTNIEKEQLIALLNDLGEGNLG